MHIVLCQPIENIGYTLQLNPVVLDVLARGEVSVTTVVDLCDMGQRTHLPSRKGAVRDRDAKHIGMLLQVQAVLQAQRQKLFLAQLTRDTPLNLIAELGNTLAHKCAVVLVVVIHSRRPHRRGGTTMHARQT